MVLQREPAKKGAVLMDVLNVVLRLDGVLDGSVDNSVGSKFLFATVVLTNGTQFSGDARAACAEVVSDFFVMDDHFGVLNCSLLIIVRHDDGCCSVSTQLVRREYLYL